jgi:hypothetical protein
MARRTALLLIQALLVPSLVVASPSRLGDPAPEISIETSDPDQRRMAEWAVGRFEDAGLVLPSIVIRFPGRSLALCRGARGLTFTDRIPMEVTMCWSDAFILLHELAHAWEAHNLSKYRRQPFMALRSDVDSWAGAEVPWHQRGAEHAANVVAWGLLEDPYPISRTYPNDSDSLIEAFRVLTGVTPLHDGGSPILHPDRSLYAGSNPPLESGR